VSFLDVSPGGRFKDRDPTELGRFVVRRAVAGRTLCRWCLVVVRQRLSDGGELGPWTHPTQRSFAWLLSDWE